jgi:hypothetical protein
MSSLSVLALTTDPSTIIFASRTLSLFISLSPDLYLPFPSLGRWPSLYLLFAELRKVMFSLCLSSPEPRGNKEERDGGGSVPSL